MSLRIACLIRRLLPLPVRLLRPAPYCPLRPLDQRRQSARQLRQVALMRRRLGHGNTLGRNRGRCFEPDRGSRWLSSRPIWSAARLQHQNTNLVVELVGAAASSARRRAPDRPELLPASAPALLLPTDAAADAGCRDVAAAGCFGGGIRTRSAGTSLPRKSTEVG